MTMANFRLCWLSCMFVISALQVSCYRNGLDDQDSWLGQLYVRPGEDDQETLSLEGLENKLLLLADLEEARRSPDFPVILSGTPENELNVDEEPVEIIQDGNMLLAVRKPLDKRWTVTDKRSPYDKRWTVTDKRWTVTDKRSGDKRMTVTDKRAPTVTDKRMTVTEKRAPTVTDKRWTVTDKRWTVTDKRAPTVTDKRWTVTDKRAPTVTDKRMTVTDKRAPTVTDKRMTVTDKRAVKHFLQRLVDRTPGKRMTVTDKKRAAGGYWDEYEAAPSLGSIVKRDIRNSEHDNKDEFHLDGWVRQNGRDYYVESVPWGEKNGVYHVVTSRPVAADPSGDDTRRPEQDYINSDSDAVWGSLSGFARSRRGGSGAGVDAMVDLLVLVDNTLWQRALAKTNNRPKAAATALKKYYTLVISLVNARFQNIRDPDLNIRVRISAMFIAESRKDSPWSDDHTYPSPVEAGVTAVDPDKVLESLRDWLVENKKRLHGYDHATAFIGYKMVKRKSRAPTAGMAYSNAMCNTETGFSTSIVEDNGGFANIGTIAHELGHSLGARHDGSGEFADCPADHNYIMAPSASPTEDYLKNFYHFSPCTIQQFKKFLSSKQATCLFDNQHYKTKTELVGQQFSPETQCRDIYGPSSGICPYKPLMKNMCGQLWCISPTNSAACTTQLPLAAVYGAPCGGGKVCKFGECVPEKDVDILYGASSRPEHSDPTQSENAVAEETPYRGTGHKTCIGDENEEYCRQIVYQHRHACNDESIRGYCCWTCMYVGGGK